MKQSFVPRLPGRRLVFVPFILALSAGAAAEQGPPPPLPGLEEEPIPEVRDERLELTLFAQTPDVVTPVGMAVDQRGRVFVIESHTHSPPQDYAGPKHDRIKRLEDTKGDGRADAITVFSEGVLDDLMNLTFAPDGTLFAIHRTGVTALPDVNDDGKADEHRQVVRVVTEHTYDHSGLLSGVIDRDGWLYLGRGNVGGLDYTYEGATGSRLRSYGDGGHIVRCRLDGSQLQRYATGFWNPFGLMFDGHGRLWATDNDPDSRGPNRLLQIFAGGDYGYRSRYGPSGLHPFVAWNGDLPGTLPFVAGIGESPGGLLDVNTTSFPEDFANDILVAVWAENSVERFAPEGGDADEGLKAKRSVLIKGGRNFRPVTLAAGPGGRVFITDWVKREYPNHGLGRIWRLNTKRRVPRERRLNPRKPFTAAAPDEHTRKVEALLATNDADDLSNALVSKDARLRAVAAFRLSEPRFLPLVKGRLRSRDARERLGALQTLRWAGGAAYPLPPLGTRALLPLLSDPGEDVRTLALLYAGESADLAVAPHLARALARRSAGERLVQVYLAALALLTPAEVQHLAKRLPRATVAAHLAPATAWQALQDRKLAPSAHALVLPYLGAPRGAAQLRRVLGFSRARDRNLRLEAVRSLGLSPEPLAQSRLLDLALDHKQPCELRQEAVVALAAQTERLPQLVPLLEDASAPDDLKLTLVRMLRSAAGDPAVAKALEYLAARAN